MLANMRTQIEPTNRNIKHKHHSKWAVGSQDASIDPDPSNSRFGLGHQKNNGLDVWTMETPDKNW